MLLPYENRRIKNGVSKRILKSFMDTPHGWAGWIRTIGMTESKSVALPLGDSPL